ncbi:MAG: carbonic anhydrase family protein [Phycisphaerales bacterium]
MPRIRSIVVPALLASCAAMLGGCQSSGGKSDVMTKELQQSMSPSAVLADLKAGNKRFASGNSTKYDWNAQVEATASGQFPKAIVLSCLDSRVPVEQVFDQGIGDLFVGRVAGNFENVDMLGSFEFGTAVAGSRLIVVLGHSACGAVKGAIDQARLGNLTATLENIEPAIQSVSHSPSERTSSNTDFVDRVVEANVR